MGRVFAIEALLQAGDVELQAAECLPALEAVSLKAFQQLRTPARPRESSNRAASLE